MRLKPRIILHSPLKDPAKLEPLVEQCLRDRVEPIVTVGHGCEALEEDIDWIVVGDGLDDKRYVTTASLAGETLKQALEFANAWSGGEEGVQQVRI